MRSLPRHPHRSGYAHAGIPPAASQPRPDRIARIILTAPDNRYPATPGNHSTGHANPHVTCAAMHASTCSSSLDHRDQVSLPIAIRPPQPGAIAPPPHLRADRDQALRDLRRSVPAPSMLPSLIHPVCRNSIHPNLILIHPTDAARRHAREITLPSARTPHRGSNRPLAHLAFARECAAPLHPASPYQPTRPAGTKSPLKAAVALHDQTQKRQSPLERLCRSGV